ncbi:MAG: T9SS type A sorting domain-containing protein [bacterium]|nr:T9SS type A sorting domain-containing protein [bacterium]
MRLLKLIFSFILISLIPCTLSAQILSGGVGYIPQSSQVDWTNAGLLNTYSTADNFINVVTDYSADPTGVADSYQAVRNAIDEAKTLSGITIIYFPGGTYKIGSQILLDETSEGNIIFQGYSAYSTVLNFTVAATTRCFYIKGSSSNQLTVTADISKGATVFSANNLSSSYNANDWIHFYENSHPLNAFPKGVGQITKLVSVNGNTGTIKDEASKAYDTDYSLKVEKITPIQNVGIEKLKIYRANTGNHDNGDNILFDKAINCWVRGVDAHYTCRHHIRIMFSSHIEISGCYFHEARRYAAGGRGYGVCIEYSTTNCLIENNVFYKFRHAMVLQGGANCNVITFNYSEDQETLSTEGDLTIHGNYPYANLLEQNIVEWITSGNYDGKKNGPYNAFVRNYMYNDDIIALRDIPQTSIIGHYITDDYPYACTGSTTSISRDTYGYESGTNHVSHPMAWASPSQRNNAVCGDHSYYYSARPDFLSTSYSFPAVGARPATSQNIPAKDRWNDEPLNKTYSAGMTQWPASAIPPPRPQNLAISNAGQAGQNPILTWSSVSGAVSYNVYRDTEAGWELWEEDVTSTTWTDQLITISDPSEPEALEVFYCVSTVNQYDTESSKSDDVSTWGEGFFKDSQGKIIAEKFGLSPNFPNPFNPVTSIRFSLPRAAKVTLIVYNLLGQEVSRLVDRNITAGFHTVKWDASRVTSGTYIYKIVAGEFTAVKKMVVIK